jgi:hypothetical protein
MRAGLFVFLAVMLACALVLAQETPPPAGTGSAQQPVPPSPQTPSPSPSTAQPSPGAAPAQPGSATAAAANNAKISPGSVIPALLAKTVDAKKAKKGDEVVAKVPQDLPSTSGQVLVPKDTKVVGHVTEVQPRSKEQKESQLAISFDRLEMKNGEQMQMPMSIQAVIAPPNRNANENQANSQGGANDSAPASPSAGTGAPSGGARGGMAGGPPSQPSVPDNAGNAPSGAQNSAGARPQITGETKGVVGISNLTLSAAPDATQGSLMTSEKNNVKLEDGTFLLLRVSPGGSQAQAPQSSPMPQK